MGRVERVLTPVNIDALNGAPVPRLEENEYRTNPWAITTSLLFGSLATLGVMTVAGYKMVLATK